ncbi:MAG: hypothetical protein FWE14_11915 [Lachnospiraceae bacterium]|nr:hypothetical protein [Lachnospiraceae bacterium]
MSKTTICVVGKDKRQNYLALYLQEQGLTVCRKEEFEPDNLKGFDYLVGPVTFYPAGKVSSEVGEACRKAQVKVINYMACEDLLSKNAELTAEGLLAIIIQNTNFALAASRILILGYGRCGKAILRLLSKFSCLVDIYDTVPASLKYASYNIVINTIPAPVCTKEFLIQFEPDCLFFEIASSPGGFDKIAIEEFALTLVNCPGIPGLYSPQSAGIAIGETVLKMMQTH